MRIVYSRMTRAADLCRGSLNQEAQLIRNTQSMNYKTREDLEARINAAHQQLQTLRVQLRSACPYAKDVDACEKELQKLDSLPPNSLISTDTINNYQKIIPQIDAAISKDIQNSQNGQSNLASIAEEAVRLYQSAR